MTHGSNNGSQKVRTFPESILAGLSLFSSFIFLKLLVVTFCIDGGVIQTDTRNSCPPEKQIFKESTIAMLVIQLYLRELQLQHLLILSTMKMSPML